MQLPALADSNSGGMLWQTVGADSGARAPLSRSLDGILAFQGRFRQGRRGQGASPVAGRHHGSPPKASSL